MDPRSFAVGRYAVHAVLGSGGFGTVYYGTDPATGRPVAVKVLDRAGADPARRVQLRAEADAMRRIDDPHCVRVLDVVDEPARAAIVTEFVNGASLRAVLDRVGRLTGPQALVVLRGALRGLVAVHAAGLIHGDLKPDNILVDQQGVSKLIDFGLAAPPQAATEVPDSVIGSPSYLSPEQIRGVPADARSDIYACAVMLYELLCGQRPFTADSVPALLARHLSAPVPDPRRLVPDIGDGLAALCRAGLAKDPAQRPQTALDFLRALEDAARQRYGPAWATGLGLGALVGGGLAPVAEHAAAPLRTPRVRAVRPARRFSRLAVGGGVATAVAAAVVATVVVRHQSTPAAQPPPTTPPTAPPTSAPPPSNTAAPASFTGRLLVRAHGRDEIVDTTGTLTATLNRGGPGGCCYGRALSPDGRDRLELGEGSLQVGPATGVTHEIWATPTGEVETAVWSPDGRQIAFTVVDRAAASASLLEVVRVDGGGAHVVATGVNVQAIAWAPDGRQIAFSRQAGTISLISLEGGAVTSLRTSPAMVPTGLAWAPGRQLIFDESGTSPNGVWTIAADGSGLRVLLAGAASPSWAPGGHDFAAVRGGRVVIADASGTVLRTVGPTGVEHVQWTGSG